MTARSVCWLLLGLVLFIVGCRDNPGKWPAAKVRQKIAESLELENVSVTAQDGGLSGSGQRTDGETVTFTVTQDPAAFRIDWDATGDRGFVEEGYYEILNR